MSERGASDGRARSSAHLGATFRSILIAPSAGFRAALRSTERRAKRGHALAEGRAPFVLAAIGGSALMLLYLKVAALVGARAGSQVEYRPSFLIVAVTLGALLGLVAQVLWGGLARTVFRFFGRETSGASARLVWGASFFPQVATVFLLLPIDLLVAGPSAFTDARPEDSVAAGWAALSLSIAVALALWSLGLLVKGIEVSSDGLGLPRAVASAVACVLCVVVVGVGFRFGLVALAEAWA